MASLAWSRILVGYFDSSPCYCVLDPSTNKVHNVGDGHAEFDEGVPADWWRGQNVGNKGNMAEFPPYVEMELSCLGGGAIDVVVAGVGGGVPPGGGGFGGGGLLGGGNAGGAAKFKVGDFVLLKRPTASSLEVNTRPHILRIVEPRDLGIAVLGGRDRTTMQEQVKHIAHCTVPVGDKRVYPELYDRGETIHCRVCGLRSYPKRMVLCDKCNEGYHTWCLTPPLVGVPEGRWTCPRH